MTLTPTVTSKLPHVGTTIFTVMSQLAHQHKAINLAQGFPDFDCPAPLRERVTFHMNAGKNQYAPMPGVPELREQIAIKTKKCYGRDVCMDNEITVTSGATESLFSAISAVVHRGDEVIIFDPAYDAYAPAVALCGGKSIHIPLLAPDYAIDWQQVKDSISDKTRLIIINSPHNPTGSVLSTDDLEALANLVRDTPILIISDEVYEHITFDGEEHASVLRHQALSERAFVISSFGKTYHTTGWKLGYCVAPKALTAEFRKVHQYLTFCSTTPMQYAVADYLAQAPEHYEALPDFYQAKRDKFCALLKGSRFRLMPAKGTYFQLLDYSDITDQKDTDYARYLTETLGVASVPISVFYENPPAQHMLRFCFAKDEKTLIEAAERLCTI